MSNFNSIYNVTFDYNQVLQLNNDSEIFSFILKNYIKDKSPNDDFDNLHNLLYDNFIVEFFLINKTLHFKFLFTICIIKTSSKYDYLSFSILQTNLFSTEIEGKDERSFTYSESKLLILNYLETNSLENIYSKLNVAIYKSLALNKPEEKFYKLTNLETIKLLNYFNEQLTGLSKKNELYFNNLIYDKFIIETKYVNPLKRTVIFKFSYLRFSYEEEFTLKKIKHESLTDALIFLIESKHYDFKNSNLREFIFLIHSSNNDIINVKNILTEKIHYLLFFITTLPFFFYYLFDGLFYSFFYNLNIIVIYSYAIVSLIYLESIYKSYSENALFFKKFATPDFNFYKKYQLFKNYMIIVIIIFIIFYIYSIYPFLTSRIVYE